MPDFTVKSGYLMPLVVQRLNYGGDYGTAFAGCQWDIDVNHLLPMYIVGWLLGGAWVMEGRELSNGRFSWVHFSSGARCDTD